MTTTRNYNYGYGGYTLDASAVAQLQVLYKTVGDTVNAPPGGVGPGAAGPLYKFITAFRRRCVSGSAWPHLYEGAPPGEAGDERGGGAAAVAR